MVGFVDTIFGSFKQTLNWQMWLYFFIVLLIESIVIGIIALIFVFIGFLAHRAASPGTGRDWPLDRESLPVHPGLSAGPRSPKIAPVGPRPKAAVRAGGAYPSPLTRSRIATVNRPEIGPELEALRQCLYRGRPFGTGAWLCRLVDRLGLSATLRPRGQPRRDRARRRKGS